jgi:hypothetical protein
VGNADAGIARVHSTYELIDQLGFITGSLDACRLRDQPRHAVYLVA